MKNFIKTFQNSQKTKISIKNCSANFNLNLKHKSIPQTSLNKSKKFLCLSEHVEIPPGPFAKISLIESTGSSVVHSRRTVGKSESKKQRNSHNKHVFLNNNFCPRRSAMRISCAGEKSAKLRILSLKNCHNDFRERL